MSWKDSQSRIIEFYCKCGLLVQTYSRTRKQCIHCSKKADAERTKVNNTKKAHNSKTGKCGFSADAPRTQSGGMQV